MSVTALVAIVLCVVCAVVFLALAHGCPDDRERYR